MLQGTFETLPLTEVLAVLARSRKRGTLLVDAGPASGAIFVEDGRCYAAESDDQQGPVEHAPALLVRLVDICFVIAQQDSGAFRFAADAAPEWTCSEPVDLDVALDELQHLLVEWRDIQQVIPSLESRVRLAPELGVPDLTVDRDMWRLLVVVDGRRTVRDLVQRTSRPVLDVCHALGELVTAGAVSIVAPPHVAPRMTEPGEGASPRALAAAPPPHDAADAPTLRTEAPYGPGVEAPHPGPVRPVPTPRPEPQHDAAHEAETDADESEPKGEFFRAFSVLRDS